LALQKNDLEEECIREFSQMTAAIQQKEFELQSLSEGEGNSDTRNLLESELNILKDNFFTRMMFH
jgi:hypothetical protein